MEASGSIRARRIYEIRRYSWIVALARLEPTPECAFYGFRGSPLYEPADHAHPPFAEAAEYAIAHYLAAFGPATRADVSQWSGVPIRDLAPASSAFASAPSATSRAASCSISRARRWRRPTRPRLPASCRAGTSCCSRTRTAPASSPTNTAKTVIHKNGDVQQTFLIDGTVAGLWRVEGERIALEPFARLPRTVRRELEDEAARLAAWLR